MMSGPALDNAVSAKGVTRMTSETRVLATYVADLEFSDLPESVVTRTRLLVMDHVGIALRARHAADLNDAMATALQSLGLAGGSSIVIGDQQGYSSAAAAFYNGNLAHSLDFDDTHARGSIHPSAPIVPAAFAAAQMTGANGQRLIAGIVAGYEVQIRLSIALNPTEHYNQGFHPTATCGVFGAAAAAGNILGLSADQMISAFGLCGSQAAGSMQFLADGAWNKPYHTGYAAMNGLVSAVMASKGFIGTAEPLEGSKGGFLRAYAPNPVPAEVVSELGERFETMKIAVKPYPSCRYGHAAIDALISLKAANDIDYRSVESVEVGLPKTGWSLIGDPEATKQNPKNYVDGQFSMAFVGAVAIREGRMGWDDYETHLKDKDTLALCRKIRTVVDDGVQAHYPANMSGVARVRTSGSSFEEMVVIAKGEPENFLTDSEMRDKFDTLVGPYLDAGTLEALAGSLLQLDRESGVDALLDSTRSSRPASLKAV
jgi:2-methylcitrate dehydratase PrpD|tara:strand:- start:10647 stop:12107 length:1461 start_codon:yes stop_codon:yes gene_type:complete